MKIMHGFSSLVLVLAAIWVLAVFADAQAQGKGQEKDKSEKNKKKNEQKIKKEKGDKDKSSEVYGEPTETADSKDARLKKIKYKPRAMTNDQMMEWTNGNPPGWSRGRKTGWGGAGAPPGQMKQHGEQTKERDREIIHIYPRGSENWDTARKEAWDVKLEQSRARILERVRTTKGMSPDDKESAIISIEGAAREGVPLEHIEANMNNAISRGMRGPDIEKMTRAMAYGTDINTDYNRLSRIIEKKMTQGEDGDDLALSIYKEIDEQRAGIPETPVKKSWWSRFFGR